MLKTVTALLLTVTQANDLKLKMFDWVDIMTDGAANPTVSTLTLGGDLGARFDLPLDV